MTRIVGVDVPSEKRVDIALRYIYGIGPTTARRILKDANVDGAVRAKNLKEDEIARIATLIDKGYEVEGQLRRKVQQNIARLRKINTWRGQRHAKGLPVRGQRTRTNARTRKGKKKTVAVKRGVKEVH